MKNKECKPQWYIKLFIIGILLFSSVCWIKSVVEIGGSVKSDEAIPEIKEVWDSGIYQKKNLSHADSIMTYFLTGQIASSQVIKGDEGWLFYKTVTDGNTMADYEGTGHYSEAEMDELLNIALNVQNTLENEGIRFLIMVPPNKSNVYPEYMSDIYIHGDFSRTDEMINYLSERGVNIISPKDELIANKKYGQLYYTYDSHWNQMGAYVGVRSALSSFGADIPPLSEREIIESNLKGNYYYGATDDLASMVGLRPFLDGERNFIIEGTPDIDWNKYGSEQDGQNYSHIINDNAKSKETVMLVGDSFRSAMVPALSEYYSDVYIVYIPDYYPDMKEELGIDCLIMEIVERHSDEIRDISYLVY